MSLLNAVNLATGLLWLLSGLLGWALCGVGHLSGRYFPALAQAGTAVGLLPTYALTLWVARRMGYSQTGTVWQALSLLAVVVGIAIFVSLAIWQGVLAWRDERETARLAAEGC